MEMQPAKAKVETRIHKYKHDSDPAEGNEWATCQGVKPAIFVELNAYLLNII